MQRFNNILLACQEIRKDSHALRQALRLIHENNASLTIAVWQPDIPVGLGNYENAIRESLNNALMDEVRRLCELYEQMPTPDELMPRLTMSVFHETPYPVEIIRRVLRHNHDLLIKDVESAENGLHAVDMALLRKCPCPVWLCRDEHGDALSTAVVAVAIDPLSEEAAGRDLAVELLKLSRSMAERMGAHLNILTCWDCKWERTARNNPFLSIPEDEVNTQVDQARRQHEQKLQEIIAASNIEEPYQLHVQKGRADRLIPTMVGELEAETLVMGTVARTGVPGFLIGNTAENITQRVNCSIIAVKPGGFVSPVEAY